MNTDDFIPTPLGPRFVAASGAFTGVGATRLLERARWRREATLAAATFAAATLSAATLSAHAVVTIRPAAFGDCSAIDRLAALDEAAVPTGALLVAEVDGQIRAALALAGGRIIADPFFPSAPLRPLLRAWAAQLPARDGLTGLSPVRC